MQRIEMRHLESAVKTLNDLTGRPQMAWVDGKAQIGNFHIYGANGGYGLHCIMNESGGVHTIVGLSTKRELNDIIRGMISGVMLGKNMPRDV
jgi:hypothetical protein